MAQAQFLQIIPSVTSIAERKHFAGIPAQSNGQLTVQPDAFAVKRLETELNEHRYYLERKVEQRTEQLVRRISLLETCNATLCDKLAQARREVAALQKQLTDAKSGMETNEFAIVSPVCAVA
jgi:predicted nuclease with TOPRIM domain